MRTTFFHFAISFAFILISVSSNAKQVQVNLKENEELIYEWTEKVVFKQQPRVLFPNQVTTIRFSLLVDKVETDKIFFTAKTLRSQKGFPRQGEMDFKDYGFPQLVRYYQTQLTSDLFEEILYQIKFLFEYNIAKREVQLINRNEILEQCFSILKDKEYTDDVRRETIDRINKVYIQSRMELFLTPFLLVDADIEQTNIQLKNQELKLSVLSQSKELVELGNAPGKEESNIGCTLNLQDGLLTRYSLSTIGNDSKQMQGIYPTSNYHSTEQFILLHKSIQKPQTILLCGHIDNPVSDQMVLYSVNKFFGSDMDTKTVYLEKAGNFRIEAKLLEKGFLAVINPNKKQNIPSVPILFYAEPGD